MKLRGLSIGGLNFNLDIGGCPDMDFARLSFKDFVCPAARNPDLSIRIKKDSLLEPGPRDAAFDIEYAWSLKDYQGGYLYEDKLIGPAYTSYLRQAIVTRDYSQADIYTTKKAISEKGLCNWILDVPLGQFLISSFLADKRGLVLHSCAIKYKDKGLVFMGPSGSGKSTLAGLWRKVKGAVVLSDERIIARDIQGKVWIFGTPWTGSEFAYANEGVQLDKLYLIHHSRENHCREINIAGGWQTFFTNIRLPLWDKDRTMAVMDTAERIISSARVFKLGFLLNRDTLCNILKINKLYTK